MISMRDVILLFVQIRDLSAKAWFVIVQNLTANVLLVLTYISTCIRGILPKHNKIVPEHSKAVAILESRSHINVNL